MGYPSYGSRRQYASQGAKRYDSDMIARAWAKQESTSGKCPASMTFEGGKFYSYATVIAERVEYNGQVVFLISDENYSSSTSRHLSHVRSAMRGKVFTVPGVSRGDSDLSDSRRILEFWQKQIASLLEDSAKAREPKHTRLVIEAYRVYLKMAEYAAFFEIDLRNYPVSIPVPELTRVRLVAERMDEDGDKVYAGLISLRLGAGLPPVPSIPALDALLASQSAA